MIDPIVQGLTWSVVGFALGLAGGETMRTFITRTGRRNR